MRYKMTHNYYNYGAKLASSAITIAFKRLLIQMSQQKLNKPNE